MPRTNMAALPSSLPETPSRPPPSAAISVTSAPPWPKLTQSSGPRPRGERGRSSGGREPAGSRAERPPSQPPAWAGRGRRAGRRAPSAEVRRGGRCGRGPEGAGLASCRGELGRAVGAGGYPGGGAQGGRRGTEGRVGRERGEGSSRDEGSRARLCVWMWGGGARVPQGSGPRRRECVPGGLSARREAAGAAGW